MNRKSALLLGGAGFIGFYIAKYLSENRDYDITIVDDFSSAVIDKDLKDLCGKYHINLIRADLSMEDSFKLLNGRYDYVYVLASVVGVNRCIEDPDEVVRINSKIIVNTAEWLKTARPGRVLFASSSENYAATTDVFNYRVPTGEDVPLCIADTRHPRFSYAVTKILGEAAFFAYGGKLNIHTVIVRYQNIYGPRMGFKHAIPHIIERVYKKENPVRIYGGGQTRAFCFASDAAEGTVLALESGASDKQVYHIGRDDEVTIKHITQAIGGIMGYAGEYEAAHTYPGSVSRRCPDISKAKKDLGYKPKVPLEQGLEKTVAWYKAFFDSGAAIPSGGFIAPEELEFSKI